MPKSGLKLSFLSFFQVWSLVFLEIGYDDSLDHCLSTTRVKAPERIFFWGRGASWVCNWVFCHFLKVASLVFLDMYNIATWDNI